MKYKQIQCNETFIASTCKTNKKTYDRLINREDRRCDDAGVARSRVLSGCLEPVSPAV
jgi:hypothetical protein